MNSPDKNPSTNNASEAVLPAGYAEMIAESNAKRALGGLAYVEAVREDRRHDISGTFPGSIKSDIITVEAPDETPVEAPVVVNLDSDSVESEQDLEKSATRHPAKIFEMPGIGKGRQNPYSQPISKKEKDEAWKNMSDKEVDEQNALNAREAQRIREQRSSAKQNNSDNER